MAETVVVTDDELLHFQPVAEHLLHEFKGRKTCHCLVEMQHRGVVDACFREQQQLVFECSQQLWHVVAVQNLSRMPVKRDHG